MIKSNRFIRKSKSSNRITNTFIAIWADDNGNGTFGVLACLCQTKEAAILEVLKDIEINNYIDLTKLEQYRLDLITYSELSIPGVVNYKIESI